jgi:hypothetical protein
LKGALQAWFVKAETRAVMQLLSNSDDCDGTGRWDRNRLLDANKERLLLRVFWKN